MAISQKALAPQDDRFSCPPPSPPCTLADPLYCGRQSVIKAQSLGGKGVWRPTLAAFAARYRSSSVGSKGSSLHCLCLLLSQGSGLASGSQAGLQDHSKLSRGRFSGRICRVFILNILVAESTIRNLACTEVSELEHTLSDTDCTILLDKASQLPTNRTSTRHDP